VIQKYSDSFFIDQMGGQISLGNPPKRIISLVPSQTELLYELGAADLLVGRTKFCVHPKPDVLKLPVVGGTKTPDLQRIIKLNPDLIIGNKEENEQISIEEIKRHFPVWMSDIENFNQSIDMIMMLGSLLACEENASALLEQILVAKDELQTFAGAKFGNHKPGVIYMIWKNPYMAAGTNTFINEMIGFCGLKNLAGGRYPEFSNEQLNALKPELIFLSSEPYPFKDKHVSEIKEICPGAKIVLVDGEMFSWYGCRIKAAFPYFKQLLQTL